eukprot:TRINITY_DN2196_c0_g2_i1.p1 TRINITY_DN2196_c0_g2~~TRINITY_DN2196_c0_g2_i1.p1  ORF type:complete len:295 (-),score=119.05 TRINITY_DN2196_c0_g2_i1:33-917(-)
MQIVKELEANAKKPVKLTAENLKNLEKQDKAETKKESVEQKGEKTDKAQEATEPKPEGPQKSPKPKHPSTKHECKKPAWALTEQQAEELEDQDVDNLLEFAYQLDYEKYIEDFEVRQALAVIKERVQELKRDKNWKEGFVAKWNQEQPEAVEESKAQEGDEEKAEAKSAKSKSVRSQTKSVKSVADTIKGMEKKEKAEWDKSVKPADGISVEEKAARQIAEQVLESAPYLKGVHSKASMQQILLREARAQLAKKPEPLIVTIKDGGKCREVDPSNLPYLHRNEAICVVCVRSVF